MTKNSTLCHTASEKPAWIHDTLETVQGGSKPERQCWGGRGQAPVTLLLVPPSLAPGITQCQLLSTSQVCTVFRLGSHWEL